MAAFDPKRTFLGGQIRSAVLSILGGNGIGLGFELVVSPYRICCVHQRGTTTHIDSYTESFLHFLAGCTQFYQCLTMKADAAVASRGNAYRKRNELFGFFVERL